MMVFPQRKEDKNIGEQDLTRTGLKNKTEKFRADDETIRKLVESSKILKVSKSEVIRKGIAKIYDEIKAK